MLTDRKDNLGLTVSVDAQEWDQNQRRIKYLEAVISQVLRDKTKIKEWYSAVEIAALDLPGLPRCKNSITRAAASRGWSFRLVKAQGGKRREYHYTSLPGRAFDALISRILDMPEPEADDSAAFEPRLPLPPSGPSPKVQGNATPPWLLPFMRVIRENGSMRLDSALRELSQRLPANVHEPTIEEAESLLIKMGMISDG